MAAITPFSFPLNLVAHKIGPAIAGGNAVLLKPASDTPLSALKLVELLLKAGLPEEAIACAGLAANWVRRSVPCACAKSVSLAAPRWASHYARGRAQARDHGAWLQQPGGRAGRRRCSKGRTVTGCDRLRECRSGVHLSQRVIATPGAHADLLDALRTEVQQLVAGDPLAEGTQVGPLIRERDAARVETWLGEAVTQGAELLCGGSREGAVVKPALLANVAPEMKLSCEELFGPALGVTRAPDVEAAIALANETRFGLSAAVFTQDIAALCGLRVRWIAAICTSASAPLGVRRSCPTAASRTAVWQGRPALCCAGNDREQDGGHPRMSAPVTIYLGQAY